MVLVVLVLMVLVVLVGGLVVLAGGLVLVLLVPAGRRETRGPRGPKGGGWERQEVETGPWRSPDCVHFLCCYRGNGNGPEGSCTTSGATSCSVLVLSPQRAVFKWIRFCCMWDRSSWGAAG